MPTHGAPDARGPDQRLCFSVATHPHTWSQDGCFRDTWAATAHVTLVATPHRCRRAGRPYTPRKWDARASRTRTCMRAGVDTRARADTGHEMRRCALEPCSRTLP
eukprot:3518188-Alexandrium_andersonii.AAC.1